MASSEGTHRIVLVGPVHPAPGGIVHFTAGLAGELSERGELLVVGWRRRFPERLYPGTIEDHTSTTRVSADGEPILDLLAPRTWRSAGRRIREFAPDLVVLQWWHPLHAPVITSLQRSCRRAGIPVALICHNVEPHESNPIWRRLTRRTLRASDVLVVHAAVLQDQAARLAPRARIITSFHPIFDNVATATGTADRESVRRVRQQANAVDRPLLVVFGYVRPYKGVEDAVAAMALLSHDAALLVAGECWDEPERYRQAVAAAGAADRVTLDFRYIPNDELPALFAAADVVVAPYRDATQSGVIALAFAYERPVVATNVGGLGEVVADGVTGALAPPADPAGLAAAIDRVLADGRDWTPAIRARRASHSWSRYVDRLLDETVRPAHRSHAILDRPSRTAKARKIAWILQRRRPLAGCRILDVGTGSGTIAATLAELAGPAGAVVSVDVADVRVDREGYAFVETNPGDPLPVESAAFDVCISNHVIEHVGDHAAQQAHLCELARVLRPGGMAYVAVPHRWQAVENHYRLPGLGWVRGPLSDTIMRLARKGDRYDCRPLGRRELAAMMGAAGFAVTDASDDLIRATVALDRGLLAGILRRLPPLRQLIRGPLRPTIVAVGRTRAD